MSDETVRDIIEGRIQDNWVLSQIDWDNVKYNPKEGTAFISPLINEVDSTVRGKGCIRRVYSLIIEVRVQKKTGTTNINTLTQALKNLFEGYTEENFYCLKGQTVRAGISKQWYQKNVIFQCHYIDYK